MDYDSFCDALRTTLPNLDARKDRGNAFVYHPLSRSTRTFRLALLYPGSVRDRLRCSFFEIPFESAPNYIAVSYTWGDPTRTSAVWTDHGKIGVTASLDSVFRRLRDPKRFLIVWIDGICINQQDNDEKGQQVRLMREIYARATETYIYLGEEADGSFQIPLMCEKIQAATGRAGYWEPGQKGTRFNTIGVTELLPTNYEQFGLPERTVSGWDAFRALLARPWFQRVWIIQEAIMSEFATVLCGDWKMSFLTFLNTLVVAVIAGMPIFGSSTSDSGIAMKLTWLVNILRNSHESGRKWALVDLLHRCRVASATDFRDCCFGILGLSAEADDEALRPSYDEDVSETYLRYARYFVDRGEGVKILYNAGSAMSGLPSWVPDWSDKRSPGVRLCPEPNAQADAQLGTPFAYAAGTGCTPNVRTVDQRPNILRVRGMRVDVISKLTSPIRGGNGPSNAIGQLVLELQDLLSTASKPRYITDTFDTVIWKTMIADGKSRLQDSTGEGYADCFRAFNMRMNAADKTWPMIHPTYYELQDPSAIAIKSHTFVQAAVAVCQKRVRGITDLGLPGQFLENTIPGDTVFVPCGSVLPLVIRYCPEFPHKFRVIGECYVHGIMEGQAFDGNESSIEDLEFI